MGRSIRFRPDVPGAPELEVIPDILRGNRVYAGGTRLSMTRDAGRPAFPIPMADGTVRQLRLFGGFLGLRAVFEGVDYPVEPRLSLWETFLVVLPLAILALGLDAPSLAGTAVAALVAAIAVGVALVVVRADRPAWLRTLAAIAGSVLGYVVAGVIAGSV
jgi:hypothetical protein